MTWANQQKSLLGHFDIGTTNLNWSVVHIKHPLLRTLINVVATIPDLIRNPENALTGLLGTVGGGSSGGKGGLAGELERSPLDTIVVRGAVGSGRFELQQGVVQSPAFQAEANGSANLAPILTNSALQFPVKVSLSRSTAERVNLAPANTPTNVAYVALPQFLTMRGTLGKPKPDINAVALGGTVLKGLGNLPIGGDAGKVLQGLSGILGGSQAAQGTNAPGQESSTNAPASKSPVEGLLNDLLKPKPKK